MDGGRWGTWGSAEKCTFPAFAIGMELKVAGHWGDDTAMNGVRLTCSDGKQITSKEQPWGYWRGQKTCARGYIKAAQIRRESIQGDGDDTAANGMHFWCTDAVKHTPHEGLWGEWLSKQTCPDGSAVMGIQTQADTIHELDVTAINDIYFFCAKMVN